MILKKHQIYCDECVFGRNFRPATIRTYKETIKQFLDFYDNKLIGFDEITADKIKNWFYTKRAEGAWVADTMLKHYKALKVYFKWCVASGYMHKNPIDLIDKPRLSQKLPKSISKQDAKFIMEYSFAMPVVDSFYYSHKFLLVFLLLTLL